MNTNTLNIEVTPRIDATTEDAILEASKLSEFAKCDVLLHLKWRDVLISYKEKTASNG